MRQRGFAAAAVSQALHMLQPLEHPLCNPKALHKPSAKLPSPLSAMHKIFPAPHQRALEGPCMTAHCLSSAHSPPSVAKLSVAAVARCLESSLYAVSSGCPSSQAAPCATWSLQHTYFGLLHYSALSGPSISVGSAVACTLPFT